MSFYTTIFYKIYHWFAVIPGKVILNKRNNITEEDKIILANLLANGYYIILTGGNNHLSNIVVSFLSLIKTGKWAKYSHVLMNCDNITDPTDRNSFKFIEATAVGVHYSTFDEVFACDNVCLLTPKEISNEEWTAIIDRSIECRGKPYDDLFDLSDDTHLSCVELVLTALKAIDYEYHFQNLIKMINKSGNLVPQMYRDCPDFIVEIEK